MYHWCVGQDGNINVNDSTNDSFIAIFPQVTSENHNDDKEDIEIASNESINYHQKSFDGYDHTRSLKTYRSSNPQSLIIGAMNINNVKYIYREFRLPQ